MRRRTVVVLLAFFAPQALAWTVWAAAKHPKPGLGTFTAQGVTIQGTVSGQPWTWTGSVALSPGAGNQRSISGTGTFTIGTPTPVPVPTPIPTPIPPNPTPIPAPPPPNSLNVRSYGATGDGSTDDTQALQRAVSAAHAGDTVFFPAGTYRIVDWVKMNHPPQVTLLGVGPSSVIHSAAGGGLMIGTGGEPGGPVTVRQLKFTGVPGATQKSAFPSTGGIQCYGPQGTIVDNCDFADVASAVYEADPSKGLVITNCRVNGWARICWFLGGNDTLTNCICTQTDPNLNGQATSHGVYCHASNCLIQNCSFYNCRKYGAQIYSEEIGRVMVNDRFINDQFIGCHDGGITLDHSQMGAGDASNILIDGCTIKGTYAGAGISIKNGDGVVVKNCLIDGSPSGGIQVGVFAPYDTLFSVANVMITGCTITHCATGLWTYPSNGGILTNVVAQGNKISGNTRDIDEMGSTAGVKILP